MKKYLWTLKENNKENQGAYHDDYTFEFIQNGESALESWSGGTITPEEIINAHNHAIKEMYKDLMKARDIQCRGCKFDCKNEK